MSILHPRAAMHVSETAAGLVVELPSPRRPVPVLVLAAWLAAWVIGLGFVSQQFTQGEGLGPDWAFLVGWACLWLAAGAAAAGYLAWLVAGCERITLGGGELRIRRGVGRIGFERTYAVADVRELRTFGRELPPVLSVALGLAGLGACGVRFRHGDHVVRCARALDEPAAHELIDLLLAHHAFPGAHGHRQRPAG